MRIIMRPTLGYLRARWVLTSATVALEPGISSVTGKPRATGMLFEAEETVIDTMVVGVDVVRISPSTTTETLLTSLLARVSAVAWRPSHDAHFTS